jgi:hypothetical protein
LAHIGRGVCSGSALAPSAVKTGRNRAGRAPIKLSTSSISLYPPAELLGLAREAGFAEVQHAPGSVLAERYFADRADGLRPSTGEDLVVATT